MYPEYPESAVELQKLRRFLSLQKLPRLPSYLCLRSYSLMEALLNRRAGCPHHLPRLLPVDGKAVNKILQRAR